jgi:hypothetical protein
VAEKLGQIGNSKKGEHPPLEAVTRILMKIVHEDTRVCVCVCVCMCARTAICKVKSRVVSKQSKSKSYPRNRPWRPIGL